ncbi:hypothetical protein C1H46_035243 [Malus baccata]|uniref:J domain-containing protein n=1 Tax=Malus baccata TaxID=106549 RepID=A0A540KY93_MALBA|nr:hypothetical protein C1H46_035243 [Malus baccata]
MAKPASPATTKSTASVIKAYSLPLILFAAAMFFQLFVIPKSFPPSHYDILGIRSYTSVKEVKEAYENISSVWNSEGQAPDTSDFIKIQYAYELLTNPVWKRNYDIFGIDEQIDVVEKVTEQYKGESFSKIDLPLLESVASETEDHDGAVMTSKDFQTMFEGNKPWLIQAIRRVQEKLSNEVESRSADEEQSIAPAAEALKSKRLTFAWLDGEAQKKYCLFFLQSENSHETCGERTDMTDVPQLFIVRYKRNVTEESEKPEKKPKSMWDAVQDQELDPASQLVAKYNGSDDTQEITKWISQIINDGDSRDLPDYRTRTPHMVPEDSEPIWSAGVQRIPSTNTIMQSIRGMLRGVYDRIGDPRLGPMLLLAALMSFGTIWLRRSQATPVSSQPNQPNSTDESKRRRRDRARNVLNQDLPPSITDMEPRDSYEMPLSGSDSE